MKNLIAVAVLCGSMILAGCTTQTEYGSCVGIGEKQNPTLHYKVSAWNVALGIIFVEMILPPIFVLVDETYCPVGVEANESH